MRIALVHELLTMKGGAEKVLRVLAEMFPDAPVYTLLYDEKKMGDWFPKERVRTSRVQKLADRWPLKAGRYNHHLYLPFFPRAAEAWDFSGFDLVISSSSAFAHGIITNGKPKHLCYVHAPARYLWDRTHDVLEQAGKGPFGRLRRGYLSRIFHRLRTWDAEAADRPDKLLAASATVQRRISLYWSRPSEVLFPPIDDVWLTQLPSPERKGADDGGEYYLVVSTLVPYKRIALAIEAANLRKTPLKIAGSGPDLERLQSLAGPTVEFLGFVPDADLPALYAGARATLFPGNEDFGLVPLESLACGTPVIAYRAGGATETLTEETAAFFDDPTPHALADAIGRFERTKRSPDACRKRAAAFSRKRFEEGIRAAIDSL
ncbi:MAG: glycosyltransferase [Candidatus Peribacteraceae bacterium]|nr:glycosyltransferase [Candidatus Peribacteraceae bacterium]